MITFVSSSIALSLVHKLLSLVLTSGSVSRVSSTSSTVVVVGFWLLICVKNLVCCTRGEDTGV